jgi:hypothetical protein
MWRKLYAAGTVGCGVEGTDKRGSAHLSVA